MRALRRLQRRRQEWFEANTDSMAVIRRIKRTGLRFREHRGSLGGLRDDTSGFRWVRRITMGRLRADRPSRRPCGIACDFLWRKYHAGRESFRRKYRYAYSDRRERPECPRGGW